ncbi:unnamed protein product, partial [marine sediment metagenome]
DLVFLFRVSIRQLLSMCFQQYKIEIKAAIT